MKKYDYNVRCVVCKAGFTPKDKQEAFGKICSSCRVKRSREIKKDSKLFAEEQKKKKL